MTQNALERLHDAGQSIWLDYIDRRMLHDGDLERRIRDDALTGMTSNPTMFEKALAQGAAYDDQIRFGARGTTTFELFERIATIDVRDACDIFLPIYERTAGADGYVSIEVSPDLAYKVDASVAEASRLWATVDRPNVMIKVPGTIAGSVVVRELTAAGINVNITLLFSRDMHRSVIDAYMAGMEDRLAAGKQLGTIHSVASFFVSRVDVEVDRLLQDIASSGSVEQHRPHPLAGKTGIANAKLAYQLFRNEFSTPRWERLALHGANVQRPLWASTGVKNPTYRDVMYVEALIGADTVVTMPPSTLTDSNNGCRQFIPKCTIWFEGIAESQPSCSAAVSAANCRPGAIRSRPRVEAQLGDDHDVARALLFGDCDEDRLFWIAI